MSTNCVKCVVNKRTGIDLLCDSCRAINPTTGIVIKVRLYCGTYIATSGKVKGSSTNSARIAAMRVAGKAFGEYRLVKTVGNTWEASPLTEGGK